MRNAYTNNIFEEDKQRRYSKERNGDGRASQKLDALERLEQHEDERYTSQKE
jgi:hypothetical protein